MNLSYARKFAEINAPTVERVAMLASLAVKDLLKHSDAQQEAVKEAIDKQLRQVWESGILHGRW